jgi:uncharacterized protein YcbK (DUF882 family)
MQLTEHFSLEELTASDYAKRKGIDNTPSDPVRANLLVLARQLEVVRGILNVPIEITSGYRCLAVNRALGSKDTSAHVLGLAADFRAPLYGTPLEVADELATHAEEIGFDQLIHEFRSWVHIGFRPGSARGQLLTIDTRGTQMGLVA